MRVLARCAALAFIVAFATSAMCQTTAFTYQGKLTDSTNPASSSYQMEFKLFNALNAGTQLGSTIADVLVTVSGGVFSVQLDFGATPFTGKDLARNCGAA